MNRGRGEKYYNLRKLQNSHHEREQANSAVDKIVLVAANIYDQNSKNSKTFYQRRFKQYMCDIKELEHVVVELIANGYIFEENKRGELHVKFQGKKMTIEALIVPEFKHNLLSGKKCTSKGHKLIIENNKTTISGKNGKYNLRLDTDDQGMLVKMHLNNLDFLSQLMNDVCNQKLQGCHFPKVKNAQWIGDFQ